MSKETIFFIITTLLAVAGLIIEHCRHLKTERRRKELEETMEEQNRRAVGPDFRPLGIRTIKHTKFGAGKPVSEEDIKALPDGTKLTLFLINTGAPVKRLSDDRPQGEGIASNREVGAGEETTYTYTLEHAKLNQPTLVKINFEGMDGSKRFHIYETIHGKIHFNRVDPA